ncbi:hypothetical protein BDZ97DRAFT_1902720 [Flammula alnicola]|nr:hypothetical protein BDZ97DRAFT_1902720 [Flammula alnicola]
MSSVYFPAHVVVLFRRLVNVVSTSRSQPIYLTHPRKRHHDAPRTNVEWRWWTHRSNWYRVDPRNGSWASLFSSPQPEMNLPPFDDNTPPPSPPQKHFRDEPNQPFDPPNKESREQPPDVIHQLLANPALFDPIRTPRYPIVLCHGFMRMHYWSNVLNILRGKVGAEVIVTSVPGTGTISSRAVRLDEQLQLHARGRGLNFLAHSMGGLDSSGYVPLSLTSISTPHRGSPFMDWCASNIGIGKLRQQEKDFAKEAKRRGRRDIEELTADIAEDGSYSKPASSKNPNTTSKQAAERSFALSLSSLPSSFTTLILSIVDSPAYANLTSNYLNDVFNPVTPDDSRVKYWSVAGRMSADSVSVWHPFWLPKMVLDGAEEKERERLKKIWEKQQGDQDWGQKTPFWADERQWGNDGLVTVQSAKWGEFLGIMEGCDHWEMRGARGIEFGVDIPAIPAIGLGSLPLASSISNLRRTEGGAPTAHGDGWGFGDWSRFVGAWKKSKAEEAAGTGGRDPEEKRTRERMADDHVVKSSTDTLSVVFDWLIERVPTSTVILRRSNGDKEATPAQAGAGESSTKARGSDEKELSAAAVMYATGVSSGSSGRQGDSSSADMRESSPPPSAPPSEMKRRMEREDKGRKRKELASKDDLERFYVALSRKMYEEGL